MQVEKKYEQWRAITESDFVTLSNDQDGVAEAVKHFWKEIA